MKKIKILALFIFGLYLEIFICEATIKAETKNMDKYVQEQLAGYLECFKGELEDKIEITQRFEVAGSEDEEYAYFVINDEKVIGEVSVCEKDGEYITCFNYGEFDEIQYAYDNKNEKIALARTDDDIVVYSEKKNKASSIMGEHTGERVNLLKNNIDIVENEKNTYIIVDKEKSDIKNDEETVSLEDVQNANEIIEKSVDEAYNTTQQEEMDVAIVQRLRSKWFIINRKENSTYYTFREVPFVKNTTKNDKGVCWAASGASIIRYHTGKKVLVALDVYNKLKKEYGGTPEGSDVWYENMWIEYGLDMNYKARKLSYTEVKNALNGNKPILCRFRRYESGVTKARSGHAVVLCGTYKYNSKWYYVYMDPNKASDSRYVVNSVSNDTRITGSGYEFYYYNGNLYYNNWVGAYWLNKIR